MSSTFHLLCCAYLIAGLSGCLTSPPPPKDDYAQSIEAAKSLVNMYGALSGKEITQYLQALTTRLAPPERERERKLPQYKVTILDSELPMAFSAGSGFIIVSKGIVLSLQTEGEFAFVLAHEMAHQELRHAISVNMSGESERYEELEGAADRAALGAIVRAGYDPREAISAIERAANKRSDLSLDTQASDLVAARVTYLKQLSTAMTLPPAHIALPKRAFVRFQALLR